MNKEIDISNVPLTPKGVNYDFQQVKKYEFVRFDDMLKVKTRVMIDPDCYLSDNEIDLSTLETDEQRVEAIINSPMIEVRKKRKSMNLTIDGDIRFNPKRDDVLETSAGCYNNYQQNRRKTIAVMKSLSSPITRKSVKSRRSVPINENLDPKTIKEKELDLLVAAVDHSQTLLSIEKKRLSDMINDWSHILRIEKDIPLENQGDIESAIGGLKILLDKRFQSTVDLLESAEKYVNNLGVPVDENNQHYRSGDIYGFVDILIDEIKKVDTDFNHLLILRNNNWVQDPVDIPEAIKVPVKKTKKVQRKKPIQSKIDIALLRSKFANSNINKGESNESIKILSNEANCDFNEECKIEESNEIDDNITASGNDSIIVKKTRSSRMHLNNQNDVDNSSQNEKRGNVNDKTNEENDSIVKESNELKLNSSRNKVLSKRRSEIRLSSSSRNETRSKSILKRNTEIVNLENSKNEVRFDLQKEKKDQIDSLDSNKNDSTNVIKTPSSSVKKGIRSKSILKSNTGTPVHEDTPRPMKVYQKINEFAVPLLNNVVVSKKNNRKRISNTSGSKFVNLFSLDSTPKKRRKSSK